MNKVHVFKGDLINVLLGVVIALDVFVLASPYWGIIRRTEKRSLYNFGLWTICDAQGDTVECFSWSEFYKINSKMSWLMYWPEVTNYISASFLIAPILVKIFVLLMPYLPCMVKSYTFFTGAVLVFMFNVLNIAALLTVGYGFEYFEETLKCDSPSKTLNIIGQNSYLSLEYQITYGANLLLFIVSMILTIVYSVLMVVFYAQIRWTSISEPGSLCFKLQKGTTPTLVSMNKSTASLRGDKNLAGSLRQKSYSNRRRIKSSSSDPDLSPPDRTRFASTPAAAVTPGTVDVIKFSFPVNQRTSKSKFIATAPSPPTPRAKPRLTRVRFDIDKTDGGRRSTIERQKTPPPSSEDIRLSEINDKGQVQIQDVEASSLHKRRMQRNSISPQSSRTTGTTSSDIPATDDIKHMLTTLSPAQIQALIKKLQNKNVPTTSDDENDYV